MEKLSNGQVKIKFEIIHLIDNSVIYKKSHTSMVNISAYYH